jgi:hypothetical protein
VEEAALRQAEVRCLADEEEARARRRERDRQRRPDQDTGHGELLMAGVPRGEP